MRSRHWIPLIGVLVFGGIVSVVRGLESQEAKAAMIQAQQLLQDRNYAEAAEKFRSVLRDADAEIPQVLEAMKSLQLCQQQLGLVSQLDSDLAMALQRHPDSYQVLELAAAQILVAQHWGVIADQKFTRGYDRGMARNGASIVAVEQDRLQALQWLVKAIQLADNNGVAPTSSNYADLQLALSDTLLNGRGRMQEWRLQSLTDISAAPNYLDIDSNDNAPLRAAPVDAAGAPVLYSMPQSWSEAKSDGERLRWALSRAALCDEKRNQAKFRWAEFLNHQFSVDTLQQDAWLFRQRSTDDLDKGEGVAAIHTLNETETIAKLASGIQRFTLADEFNPIKIYQEIAESKGDYAERADWQLIQISLNRRQYPQAAARLEQHIALYGDTTQPTKRELLDNIREPRIDLAPVSTQPAGKPAKLSLLFRNATQIAFTARRVDVERILLDTKNFYRNYNPQQPNNSFGGRKNESPPDLNSPGSLFGKSRIENYLLEQIAEWNQPLEPRDNHWDRRIEVATPLMKAGLYLVEGVANGETRNSGQRVRCLVWIADTAIVQKTLVGGKWWLSVVDAITGQAVAGANIELFGFGTNHENGRPRPQLITENFAARTSNEGTVEVDVKQNMEWYCAARTQPGSLALLGFQSMWQRDLGTEHYAELKAYGVSDRPLYRPGEKVKAKFWIGYATYGDVEALRVANQDVTVSATDPQGINLIEKKLRTDEFGACELELDLPKSAQLGRYNFQVQLLNNESLPNPVPQRAVPPRRRPIGGRQATIRVPAPAGALWASTSLAIRVEEYRKPEFEVNILAPEKPVALGETVKARIEAKYYFGAPVTEAEVSVKVERETYRDSFYPLAAYDWCYGPGYWWFAQDYTWYPNWRSWYGCIAPSPQWRPRFGFEPPELVLEQQVQLDSTGSAVIDIDTALAKAVYGDESHRYSISVEVRDASRRTITAQGSVIAALEPFKIYSWVDRGYYHVGDRINAHFQARQLDGTPVDGKGRVELLRIRYDAQAKPQEQVVVGYDAASDVQGNCSQVFSADQPGQYRVRLRLTDAAGHEIEGGYIFTIRGGADSGGDFQYNALELIPDKQHYAPGETVRLQVAANRENARVAVFVRPSNGNYQPPQWLTLSNKSAIVEIPVNALDQPNFFVEAVTIYDGQYHQEVREIAVPPEDRVLDVKVAFDKEEYLPGEEARVTVDVTDPLGKPIAGSCVIAAYDRALDAIGSDVLPTDIREFFWKWKHYHSPQHASNLGNLQYPIFVENQRQLTPLGLFGGTLADDLDSMDPRLKNNFNRQSVMLRGMGGAGFAPGAAGGRFEAEGMVSDSAMLAAPMMARGAAPVEAKAAGAETPKVRKDFADSALWLASLRTDSSGHAQATFTMPENLTSWQLRTWAVASNTRVGSASSAAVTRKPLLVRLLTPRFLVERDEVIVSAIVHNDLPGKRSVKVSLEIDGETQLDLISPSERLQTVSIDSHQQARVDWRCKATAEGTVKVRALALAEDASDAMQLELPIVVNGILKLDAFAGTVRDGHPSSEVTLNIPAARRVEQSKLVVRMSPSLAASMIDALPYLVEYPYGCTEQTLNRFLPAAITQRTLQRMNIDLAKLKEKRNNLNAQEIGDPAERPARWQRFDQTAVFDDALVADMVAAGVARLADMQNSDGGWGWFSGTQETSGAHTTATVVRGLLIAEQSQIPIVPDVLQRGLAWLEQYQQQELVKLQNADGKVDPYKLHPDNVDALVFHVLVLSGRSNPAMQQALYSQREHLSTYGKALLAWAVHKLGDVEQTNMLKRNIEQFLVEDAENETAFLRSEGAWWYWYGSEIEANAIYLKLLAAVEPKGRVAPRVVKYLLNNRKHATYWSSTRDTALVIEAFADFIAASGELKGSVKGEVYLSGKRLGSVEFTPENLFEVQNSIEIQGSAIPTGAQQLEIRRTGQGNLYWNVYATNFTLEEDIAAAGLEVKIDRRYYQLQPISKDLTLPDAQANVVQTQKAGYHRMPIEDLRAVPTGELVEVELLVTSKNDYEYLLIEDHKAASLEAVETQSGYFYNAGLSIYRELREQHVGLCIRWLPRGQYSIRYQMRTEAPGAFTALPAVIQGMYAPELRGNSTDFDLRVEDSIVR